MLWSFPWSDGLKKRACRYLLQRYLGQFLQEKLSLDQLSVDLYSGIGNINDVCLDVKALNEIGDSYNLPLEFVEGYVGSISVSIPWSSLLRESSSVEVHGLQLTLQPKRRSRNVSTLDTLWDSMCSVTSLQMARDFAEQQDEEDELRKADLEVEESSGQPLEGLERFANAIDTVFRRIKVSFTNMVLRVEHPAKGSKEGLALEIRVERMDYCDEAGVEIQGKGESVDEEECAQPSPISVRRFRMQGLRLFTDRFPLGQVWSTGSFTSSTQQQKSPDFSPNGFQQDLLQHLISPEGTPKAEDFFPQQEDQDSNPVLISKMSEPLELRLRLKQDESLPGPKVDIEVNSGAVPLFLNPSQVRLLWEMARALYLPEARSHGGHNIQQQQQLRNKPMGRADFCLVEQELQNHLSNPSGNGRSLRQPPHQAWSSHSLDDSDDDFHPARLNLDGRSYQGSEMDSSFNSRYTALSESVTSRDSMFDRTSFTKNGRIIGTMQDLLGEECSSTFRLTFSSLFLVLLHEDVSAGTPTCPPNGLQQCKDTAEQYFQRLTTALGHSRTSLTQLALGQQFTNICSISHLRFLACPLVLEGKQCSSGNNQILTTSLTIARCDLLECLVDKIAHSVAIAKSSLNVSHTHLVKFSPSESSMTETAIRLKYTRKESLLQTFNEPVSVVTCSLGSFSSEVDISIIDRLQALLGPASWPGTSCHSSIIGHINETEDHSLCAAERTDIKLSCPFVVLKLRFPVPDLRSVHSLERPPWWQKSLRKESLILELTRATLETTLDSRPLKVALQCKDANGLMEMDEGEAPIAFGRISVDPSADPNCKDSGFDWPRVVLMMNPPANQLLLEAENVLEEETEDPSHPMTSVYAFKLKKQEPSPFSCRRVAYDGGSTQQEQRIYTGATTQQEQRAYDSITPESSDQVIMPADKEHMSEFIDKTLGNSRVTLEFSLPSVHVHFPSKEFYEIFFNRITTDLLLWTPAVPQPMYASGCFDFQKDHLLKDSTYYACKSGAQCESSSDSEDGAGGYHSALPTHHSIHRTPCQIARQSNMAINISIVQGIFNFKAPLLDSQDNAVEDFCGEFQVHIDNGTVFLVNGHNGDPHVSYTCLLLNDGALFHQGKVGILQSPKRLPPACLKDYLKWNGPAHLQPMLYRSGSGVLSTYPAPAYFQNFDFGDLFSLVVRTGLDENQGLKTFKVVVGLQEATLRHRVSLGRQSWLSQLLNFFDVDNHPVAGYSPPAVITELHLHLRSCAVDYRPLYLPLRALATVENFSISSNLAAQSTTSLLRIISEELSLFVSNKTNTEVVDLKKNYVCVLDTGLFDFSLRKTDGKDPKVPEVDLRATNNTVHVHTCADSCRALQELLLYYVGDGDLMGNSTDFFDAQDTPSVKQGGEGAGGSLVGRLMDDAMLESPVGSTNGESVHDEQSSNADSHHTMNGSANVSKENFFFNQKENILNDIDDDEFCILEEDYGTGILNPSGEPQVRLLSMGPLRLVENHFGRPIRRQDLLKAPSDFPPPIKTYTLREMSLVWHLYGGSDFQPVEAKKQEPEKKTRIVIDETQEWRNEYHSAGLSLGSDLSGSVSYKKGSQHESVWDNLHVAGEPEQSSSRRGSSTSSSENAHRSPKAGGKSRRQEVCVELQMNKVRFQHEEYGSQCPQAYRQVLLVQEVEVRDRLASSDFNKFLYQFTSEANPRQTHAHMLVVKATHVRPNPSDPSTSECALRVSLKPLRLNIDQDTLIFLCDFFTQLSNQETSLNAGESSVGPVPQEFQKSPQKEDLPNSVSEPNNEVNDGSVRPASPPTYFRSFVFSPDVLIQLDYQGKRVQMEQGALAGLLMGLAQLNRSKIMLKRLSYRHGLLGVDRLFAYALNEWLQDIKKSQLPSLLGGVGPMASFVQLFQGVRDLIWLPIEQYRKDGRLMRGLQRGANSFTTSTTVACLELTGRLVHLIQGAAEFAYDMVSPGPSVKGQHVRQILGHHNHHSEPMDIREGVAKAYLVVREGLGDTARTIVRVAAQEHEHKGVPGAVGGVLRQLPPIAVKPILLATEATRNVLEGVRYQLVPDARREAVEKWRGRTNH